MGCCLHSTPSSKTPSCLGITFGSGFPQEGPAEAILQGQIAADPPGIGKVPFEVVPDFPCSYVDTVFRHLELLGLRAGSRYKNVSERVSCCSSRSSNGAIKGSDNRAISSTVVIFDLGVGPVEGSHLIDVVSGDFREVILHRVQIRWVAIRL